MCSFQLQYEYVSCAQGGTGRAQLVLQIGRYVSPVLHDPATGMVCEGRYACDRYLRDVYGLETNSVYTIDGEVDKLQLHEQQIALASK